MHTQIVLTRLFSVLVWYHFAFFAISVALLGLSASALTVHGLQRQLRSWDAARVLAATGVLFATSIVLLAFVLLHVTPDWFGAGAASAFTVFTPKLLGLFCLTTAPFFVGGFAISFAISRWPHAIHRNYANDLAGAAIACAIVIPVLDHFGGPQALIVSASMAALAAVVFASAGELARRMRTVGSVLLASSLLIGSAAFAASTGALQIRVAKGLDLTRVAPEYNRWNSFSLVSVFPSWSFRGWGLSPKYTDPIPPEKSVVIDMNAFTPMLAFHGDFSAVRHTRFDLSALAYRLRPVREACVVGAGGGKDVLAALASGARRVTAVEVNPLIAEDVMLAHYREFNGGLYARPDVELHIADGRSFLRGSKSLFDVILISMVDTSAATAAGAYALAENSLYSVDAFKDFLARLNPDGVLTVSSVSLPGLAVGARFAAVAREALHAMGRDPARCVAVVDTPWLAIPNATMHNVLIKPSGFNDAEQAKLAEASETLGFQLDYLPNRPDLPKPTPEHEWIARTLREPNDARLARERAGWALDVTPVDDDRPYFFYQNRLRDSWQALWGRGNSHLFGNGLAVLLKILLASFLMVAVCIGGPLVFIARRDARERRAISTTNSDLWYVGCLGLGYMFIELGCIQRLNLYLGTPTYALTAVLLVLLLSGGAGSRSAGKRDRSTIFGFLAMLVGYAVVWVVAWPHIATATVGLPIGGRAVIAGGSMIPLGFLMGIPLPSGLTVVQARDRERVAWLWGVNGATSVFGSVLATLASMHAGIAWVLVTGILLYAAAALLWRRLIA
jgi:spermidine synthase